MIRVSPSCMSLGADSLKLGIRSLARFNNMLTCYDITHQFSWINLPSWERRWTNTLLVQDGSVKHRERRKDPRSAVERSRDAAAPMMSSARGNAVEETSLLPWF